MVLSWERKGKRHGRLLLYAFFGLFARKKIVRRLIMRGSQFKGSNPPLLVIFGLGASCT